MLGIARAVTYGAAGGDAPAQPTPAPVINGFESIIGIGTANLVQNVSLAGQTYTADDYLLALGAIGGGQTIDSCAGASDDTYTTILETGGGAGACLRTFEGTVVSGLLDASINFTLSANRRFTGGLITISGAGANPINPDDTDEAVGLDNSPQSPAIETVTDNCLVLSIIGIAGSHGKEQIEGATPAGWTFLFVDRANLTAAPSNAAYSTLAVAWRVQGAPGVVPAATWTAAISTASMAWRAQTIALRPSAP